MRAYTLHNNSSTQVRDTLAQIKTLLAHTHTHTHTHKHTHTHAHICTYIYTYIYTYVYIYIHIAHTHRSVVQLEDRIVTDAVLVSTFSGHDSSAAAALYGVLAYAYEM